MATNPITPLSFPATPPMPAVARILSRFTRPQLEGFIAVAIDLADTLDGDPEAEELPLEDGFVQHDETFADQVADNEGGAYVEWHTKPSNLRRNGQSEILPSWHEDDEDDDPGEDNGDQEAIDEREPFDGAMQLDGPCIDYCLDQSRGSGPDNPVML